MLSRTPAVLVICDGWGHSDDPFGNAIAAAATPRFDALLASWPHTLLAASGAAVGLPVGQQGNSEVGHLTIGTGRIINQPLARINNAVSDGSIFEIPALNSLIDGVRARGSALHCLGMVSPGGVHSHMAHGLALAELAKRRGLERVYFDIFSDGRDEAPRSAAEFVGDFVTELGRIGCGRISSLSGRYWAMDRDQRWDRVERAYDVWLGGGAVSDLDPVAYIDSQYRSDISDEFIAPVRFRDGAPLRPGDGVIVWNFRPDRARQLTHALVDKNFEGFARGPRVAGLDVVTFTEYDRELATPVAFPRDDVTDTLAEIVSAAGLRQFHVAETEKYAHVTYFINGGREQPFAGEERLLVASPKVATYDTTPAMSAVALTDAVVERVNSGDDALVVLNFANPDMVGHTGDFAATVAAVEVVDKCLGQIVDATLARGGAVVITADHGNAEHKVDIRDNSPLTAHTTNPVPVLVCGSGDGPLRGDGGLRDVAPTVLAILGLPVPSAMTGASLIEHQAAPAQSALTAASNSAPSTGESTISTSTS